MTLSIADVKVEETYRTPRGGLPEKVVRVTYFVGKHGPFGDDYLPGDFSAEKAQRAMEARRQAVELLTGE